MNIRHGGVWVSVQAAQLLVVNEFSAERIQKKTPDHLTGSVQRNQPNRYLLDHTLWLVCRATRLVIRRLCSRRVRCWCTDDLRNVLFESDGCRDLTTFDGTIPSFFTVDVLG